MYATLKEIKESRERALVVDSGNPYRHKTPLRKQSYHLYLIAKLFVRILFLFLLLMMFQRHPIHLVLVLLSYQNVIVPTAFLHQTSYPLTMFICDICEQKPINQRSWQNRELHNLSQQNLLLRKIRQSRIVVAPSENLDKKISFKIILHPQPQGQVLLSA